MTIKQLCVKKSIEKYGEDVFQSKEFDILLDVLGNLLGSVVVTRESSENDA